MQDDNSFENISYGNGRHILTINFVLNKIASITFGETYYKRTYIWQQHHGQKGQIYNKAQNAID